MSDKQEDHKDDEGSQTLQVELEEAKRFYALKEWSQAADKYGEVLESMREVYDEEDAIFAPVFHRYGHALLEYAIATSGALGGSGGGEGKDAFTAEPKTVAAARAGASSSSASHSKVSDKAAHDPRFTFGGDAEESDSEEEPGKGETKPNGGGEGEGDGEEDDDLSLAFSILELARVRYEKILKTSEAGTMKTLEGEPWSHTMIQGQLAEVLNDLADVGLESENFQQASSDYQSSLEMLTPLLQPHSRRLADAYLRLGLALEFHPDTSRQATAEKYVAGACTTMEKRLEALQARERVLQKERETGEIGLARAEAAAVEIRAEKAELEGIERLQNEKAQRVIDGEGIGNRTAATRTGQLEKDDVIAMDWDQLEKERKDVGEMIQDLKLKLEEYAANVSGEGSTTVASQKSGGKERSAKETLQQAINEALLGSSTNALGAPPLTNPNAPVNDLSSLVKKKKKPDGDSSRETTSNGKRKEGTSDAVAGADIEADSSKKAKLD
ncbi:hypothetical protein CBS101457_001106 [Exobasidium rhododendri]|nr:hypothetical protein CBS101457_001106 [Exobasidium rhododendri]